MELLKRIILGKKQRENALKLTLVKAKSTQQAVDSEENARLEKEAYQTLPVLSEGQQPPSDLECLVEGITELNPKARQHFIDAVIAEHYGIKIKWDGPKEQIPYIDIHPKIEREEKQIFALAESIVQYYWIRPDRIMENLEKLASFGVVEQEKTKNYLAALRRLHSLFSPTSILFTPSLIVNAAFSCYGKKGDLIEDKKRLIKHFKKRSKNYELDLNVALDYAQRLQEQLNSPSKLNGEYSSQFYELPERISQAKEYLSKSINLFKEIESKMCVEEKPVSNESPRTQKRAD